MMKASLCLLGMSPMRPWPTHLKQLLRMLFREQRPETPLSGVEQVKMCKFALGSWCQAGTPNSEGHDHTLACGACCGG